MISVTESCLREIPPRFPQILFNDFTQNRWMLSWNICLCTLTQRWTRPVWGALFIHLIGRRCFFELFLELFEKLCRYLLKTSSNMSVWFSLHQCFYRKCNKHFICIWYRLHCIKRLRAVLGRWWFVALFKVRGHPGRVLQQPCGVLGPRAAGWSVTRAV